MTLDLPVATLRRKQKQVKFILLLFSPVSKMQPFQHGAPVKIMNGIVYIVSFLRSLRSLRSACVSLNTQRVSVWVTGFRGS